MGHYSRNHGLAVAAGPEADRAEYDYKYSYSTH